MRAQPVARPSARQGLKAAKTLPNSALANTSPTQKTMKTKLGAKLSSGLCVPARPATTTSDEQHHADRAADDLDRPRARHAGRAGPAAGASGRAVSFGSGHSSASATNETTSTTAAAHPNSHSGIGRLARWTSP